jgi:hypothetical protein
MTKERDQLPHQRLLAIGLVVAGVASFGGLIAMVVIAIEKVQSGHGTDPYRTFWMVEFNWIGFLILLAVLVAALTIGIAQRIQEQREIKQLLTKYSKDRHV